MRRTRERTFAPQDEIVRILRGTYHDRVRSNAETRNGGITKKRVYIVTLANSSAESYLNTRSTYCCAESNNSTVVIFVRE